MVSIIDMPTIKYWKNLVTFMDTSKDNIPKQCRIGDACFTSLTNTGGNLFTRHPNNLNHVHKESDDILPVIIILGTYIRGEKHFLKWNEYG